MDTLETLRAAIEGTVIEPAHPDYDEAPSRGGGHNVAGNGTVDGGIVLDLGGLTDVEVARDAREVHVAAGATLGDLDRATEPFGLAGPVGVISGTGVAGLTLGGGVGWLTHARGLSADDLPRHDPANVFRLNHNIRPD